MSIYENFFYHIALKKATFYAIIALDKAFVNNIFRGVL